MNKAGKRLYQWGLLDELPPLVDLPVIRNIYCSQEMTDAALRFLWEKEPELVRAQGKVEPGDFDAAYIMELSRIIEFFRKEAVKEIEIPTTRLGMLDLTFELSRRLRKALKLPEYPIKGKPLAETPQGPWPELPRLPIPEVHTKAPFNLTQEMVDRLIDITYKNRPEFFYETAEVRRRGGVWPHDVANEMIDHILSIAKPEDQLIRSNASMIRGEAVRRVMQLLNI